MAEINLRAVSVEFPVYNGRNLKQRVLQMATGGSITKDHRQKIIVQALQDINLHIQHGDRVGLIGHNGSGKSTLLRVLARIYEPTHGDLLIDGHISPMLDLMHGIEAEFSGYDNIVIRGILLGLTRREINQRIQEIAEFTGLGDYLDMPVRTYSAGMKVRLAFAVSASITPEILLIDEVFAAGDANFIQKAREKMESLLKESSIVVLASHSNELIKEFCNKAILLDQGSLKYFGDTQTALELYYQRK